MARGIKWKKNIETKDPTYEIKNEDITDLSAKNDVQSNENIEKMLSQMIIAQYQNNLLHTKQEWTLMHKICMLQNEDTSNCAHIKDYIECLELKGLGECKIDLSN